LAGTGVQAPITAFHLNGNPRAPDAGEDGLHDASPSRERLPDVRIAADRHAGSQKY
jgi:hypothetical protein